VEFVQKNIWLIIVALVSGGMLLWPLVARFMSGAREIASAEAVHLMNRRDALMLDVRSAAEFASGRIPGSRHIPADELERRLKELEKYKSRPIIVNGDSRAGSACATLRKHGFAEVFALRGGTAAWRQDNLPLEKK
jgi:rhodanese-related sulfurtransferase